MEPLASIKHPVMMRVPRETHRKLHQLARAQGLREGPFATHIMQTIAECPPERFHAALAAFLEEATRRR